MRDIAALIKAASHRDIQQLSETAGFRHAVGRRFHCIHGPDRKPSAYLYPDHPAHIYCFVCGRSWDAIDLEQEATGCTFREAARRLTARYGIENTGTTQSAFTSDDYAYAQLFKAGMVWMLEELLASLKELVWVQEKEYALDVLHYTHLLSFFQSYCEYETTEYFLKFGKREPAAAAYIMERPAAFQKMIAQLIAKAGWLRKEGETA